MHRLIRVRGRALAVLLVVVAAVGTTVLEGCASPGREHLALRNRIVITGVDRPHPSSMRESDVAALRHRSRAPDVVRVTPVLSGTALMATQQTTRAMFFGSTSDYFAVSGRALAVGAAFTAEEESSGTRVAVVGPGLVAQLFGGDPRAAVGRTMRIGRFAFTIRGVTEATRGDDNYVIMPISAARMWLLGPGDSLSSILVESTSAGTVNSALNQVYAVLDAQRLIRQPAARDYTAEVK